MIATRSGARRCARDWRGRDPGGADADQAPNANAYAERFVRTIKEECLHRMIPFGERISAGLAEYVEHYTVSAITGN